MEKSGWEVAWDIIKTILIIVSFAFIILFIVSLFSANSLGDAGKQKQKNIGSGRNGKHRLF